MKKIIALALLTVSTAIFSQTGKVGINTKTPLRTLHVQGNMRIKDTDNKNLDPNYSQVLIQNPSNGFVDHANKSNYGPFQGANTANQRTVPIDGNTYLTSETTLGCLSIRYRKDSNIDGQIQMKTCQDEWVTDADDTMRGGGYLDSYGRYATTKDTWKNVILYNFNGGLATYQGIFGLFYSNTMYKVNVSSGDGANISISIQQLQ